MTGLFLAAVLQASAMDPAHPVHDELQAWAERVGEAAFFVGACERFYDPTSADQFVSRLLTVDLAKDAPVEVRLTLQSVWSGAYAEGRVEPMRHDWDQAFCARMVDGSTADAQAAGRALDAAIREQSTR